MPAWLAAMTQLPTAKAVTVLPATVQIGSVVDVNVTALPDAPPVAVKAPKPPTVSDGIAPKLMLCEPGPTTIVWVTCKAAV